MGRILLNLPSANARSPQPAPDSFMPIYTRLLFFAGVWPPRSEKKRRIYRFYSIFIAAWLGVNCFAELGGLFFTKTLDAFGESVCSTVFRGLAFCEVVSFAIRPDRVQKMFDTLADIVTRSHGSLNSEKVQECPKIANRFSLRFLKGMGLYFIFSSAGVVFQPVMLTLLRGRAPSPFLASGFWLFGITADGMVSNVIIYASQSVSQFLSTLVCVTYECFAVSLTYHGACQARALNHMLSSLQLGAPDSSSDPCKPPTYEKARSQLKYCIRLHQDILRFSDELRNICEEIVLIQFMASLSFIATLLYQVAVVCKVDISNNKPSFSTSSVGSAAISSSWTFAPSSLQRMLIPILIRSGKSSSLWCWKLSRVELHTWIQILNKAYSFYALMRDRG